jgi:hypothetical protein
MKSLVMNFVPFAHQAMFLAASFLGISRKRTSTDKFIKIPKTMATPPLQRRDPNAYGVCPPGCLVKFIDEDVIWKVFEIYLKSDDYEDDINEENFDPELFKTMEPRHVQFYGVYEVNNDDCNGEQANHEEVVPIPLSTFPTEQPSEEEVQRMVDYIREYHPPAKNPHFNISSMMVEFKARRPWWNIDER